MKKLSSYVAGLAALLYAGLPLAAQETATEAATPAAATPKDQNFIQTLIMIGLALVFFYFILWRPEQKRRKAMEQQRGAMKKGDRVTAMGIIGTVAEIQDKSVILKMVDGSKIEVVKGAITDVQSSTVEEKK